ncbi:dihydroxyacetone kinase phosphoryl donor subunit DhaM [Fundicoccus culcitae]|uniref:phosphoenolpyruvate--glycerone phosphotransferase n=1 Tax=Fundicoccus culcitae TaxID=2969821 RepID=A0ABY5P4F9_9LACT|nr:dihydroxyacetone kinase phosphoryl donor subunit DhaM [Fundicoccus culcitae]UUX33434.1 dihydroxyacetone kinase phosphoryl donor subunit DhaM [Fundicoccus culcitae]
MSEYGVVIVSHSKHIAQGVYDLVQEVAKDVAVTYVGGTEDGGIGTSFDGALEAIDSNAKDKLLAFFDLGSARLNLELALEMSDKEVTVYSVPLVEGAYTAAALLQVDSPIEAIVEQLDALTINK